MLLSERFEASGRPATDAAEAAWLGQRAGPTAGPTEAMAGGVVNRVAVLPFENLGLAEDDYFTDGMTDEVRSKLARLSGMAVIARASASAYAHSSKSPREIAHELAVGYLLTATVRWQKSDAGSRVRVTPELVEVSGEAVPTIRWQDTFDAELRDVFQVQGEVATRVAEALRIAIGARDRGRLGEAPTSSLAAYDAYLEGQEVERSGVDPGTLRRAATRYEQAVALDPAFALAWAQLATVRALYHHLGPSTGEDAMAAREAAQEALGLAPELPEAHWAMGTYLRLVGRRPAEALASFARGLRHAPGNATLLSATALAERELGRWEEAHAHLLEARRLDPRSWRVERLIANTLLFLRRYPEVRAAADRGIKLAPSKLDLVQSKAMAYLGEGDLSSARAVVAAAMERIEPTAVLAYFAWYFDLGWVFDRPQRQLLLRLTPAAFSDDRGAWALSLPDAYRFEGDLAKMPQLAEEARLAFEAELAEPSRSSSLANLAWALALLGRRDEAVSRGEQALAGFPVEENPYLGPVTLYAAVRLHGYLGNRERALDLLAELLGSPAYVSTAWLRIDPGIDPLRGDPRFEALMGGEAGRPAPSSV